MQLPCRCCDGTHLPQTGTQAPSRAGRLAGLSPGNVPCCTGRECRPMQPGRTQWAEAALALQQSASLRRTLRLWTLRPGSACEFTGQEVWLAPQAAAASAPHLTPLCSVVYVAQWLEHNSQVSRPSDSAQALGTAAAWPYQSAGCCSGGRSQCSGPKQRPLCQAAGRALHAGWCCPGLLPSQRASASPPPGTGLLPGSHPGQAWVVSADTRCAVTSAGVCRGCASSRPCMSTCR